jgi:hypothetical protein
VNLESLALDAVAGNDGDIGIDVLKCVQNDLYVLRAALTNPQGVPNSDITAGFVTQIISRIDLALALAEDGEKSEAAQ